MGGESRLTERRTCELGGDRVRSKEVRRGWARQEQARLRHHHRALSAHAHDLEARERREQDLRLGRVCAAVQLPKA